MKTKPETNSSWESKKATFLKPKKRLRSEIMSAESTDDKKKKRRKRKKQKGGLCSNPEIEKKCFSLKQKPLNGMILSVSTLDKATSTTASMDNIDHSKDKSSRSGKAGNGNQSNKSNTDPSSYRSVTSVCQELGATVSSQIHKKVQCLVCTESAFHNKTQRVRKAQRKFNIPIINISWIYECQLKDRRVDYTPYIFLEKEGNKIGNDSNNRHPNKVELLNQKQRLQETSGGNNKDGITPIINEFDGGWSEPLDVGCCCVCHENGTTKDCEWCNHPDSPCFALFNKRSDEDKVIR